jgi:hypothetical protein
MPRKSDLVDTWQKCEKEEPLKVVIARETGFIGAGLVRQLVKLGVKGQKGIREVAIMRVAGDTLTKRPNRRAVR